jgi:hypothetical protein
MKITEAEFVAKWGARVADNGDLLEYHQVKGLPIARVWTIVETGDPDDESWYALPGFHIVNKLGYCVTRRRWTTGEEEAEWFVADFD